MFAIFQTEKAAQAFTDSIHAYLCKNRSGYAAQTERWSDVTKHKDKKLYAVPLPPEHIDGDYNVVGTLDGWLPEPEGMI